MEDDGPTGSRLLLVSPFALTALALTVQAVAGLTPFRANVFLLYEAAVALLLFPQISHSDASLASLVLHALRRLLLPASLAWLLVYSSLYLEAYALIIVISAFLLLLASFLHEGKTQPSLGRAGDPAFYDANLAAVASDPWPLHMLMVCLVTAVVAKRQRLLSYAFEAALRPPHRGLSAILTGTTVAVVPVTTFFTSRIVFGMLEEHSCDKGEVCLPCGLSGCLAAISLLLTSVTMIYVPQATVLFTPRGLGMSATLGAGVAAVGLIWLLLLAARQRSRTDVQHP